MELGQKIKEIRLELGMTQEEFAKQIKKINRFKTTKSNVSKWEKGLHVPNELTLKAIYKLRSTKTKESPIEPIKLELLKVVDYSYKMYLELEDGTRVNCTDEDMDKYTYATRNYKTVYFFEGMLLVEL